ncbi:uncharacterized protein BX664DRAFT_321279 [Halteromyces radiatus]|uniref:uncharacterized protein n=1 Tax=Halteromyces radiatus TaxID=101107 RepID=UPI00221EEED7|nr:uncharacterized protein BX664DRAFT_321279 [Halteromyces radiatus]KAI8099454.1 hypothetical protein BX664DRAFT_321279 [Halteromyces radiatus]
MKPVTFVKGTFKKQDQEEEETLLSQEQDGRLGAQVANIYQSIITPTTTAAAIQTQKQSIEEKVKKDRRMKTIYCESCDMEVRDPKHFSGTAHLVSIQSSPPSQSISPSTKGATLTRLQLEHGQTRALQLMEKQGWRQGQGLGKTNQGQPYPVTTIYKHDRLGIGHPRTDRRRITHPSVTSQIGKNKTLIKGKQLVADAKAEATLRSAMLHYMNH